MLALTLVASCTVVFSGSALAQADKGLPPNTIDRAAFERRRMAIGT
jgi:hypothetical protein